MFVSCTSCRKQNSHFFNLVGVWAGSNLSGGQFVETCVFAPGSFVGGLLSNMAPLFTETSGIKSLDIIGCHSLVAGSAKLTLLHIALRELWEFVPIRSIQANVGSQKLQPWHIDPTRLAKANKVEQKIAHHFFWVTFAPQDSDSSFYFL